MGYTLLQEIHSNIRENEAHYELVEKLARSLFEGVDAAFTEQQIRQAWESGEDNTNLSEVSDAGAARAVERDWVKGAAPAKQDSDMEMKSNRIGLTVGEKDPAAGNPVLLGRTGGIGRVVSVDPAKGGPVEQVIIRDENGNEKVFSREMLVGPRMVKGRDGKAVASWMLKN